MNQANRSQPVPHARLSAIAALLAALLLTLCSACGTFVAHKLPASSADEIVELRCYARYYFFYAQECHITSVDGLGPGLGQSLNLGAELSPGRHSIEFVIETTIPWLGVRHEYCKFEHDFSAGYRYRIVPRSLESEREWGVDGKTPNKSIELEQSRPDGEASTQRIALFCTL